MQAMVRLDPKPGQTIVSLAEEMCDVARKFREEVRARLNDVEMVARPYIDSAATVVNGFWEAVLERERKEAQDAKSKDG